MSSNILSLSGVHMSHDGRPLITDLSLGVDAGEKVGLIGANGAGKSTLLHLIAGLRRADQGQVVVRGGTRVGFLPQLPTYDDELCLADVLDAAFDDLKIAIADYERAAEAMSDDAADLLHRIEDLGGWDYEHRIQTAASQLGLDQLDARVGQLSGGERKRVALARLLLESPDLVLVDEPTNHLDASTVAWLQDWLTRSQSTVILVTHDRYFLDDVVTRLVELRDGNLASYRGNYTDYLAARAVEEAHRERTHHRQLQLLMGELEWARRSPKARTTKSRARLDRIEEAQQTVTQLAGQSFTADFAFGEPPRLGGIILSLRGVSMAYDDGPALIEDLTLELRKKQRIGILGPNGVGKSTLLKLIIGSLKPNSGDVVTGSNTEVAYFDQHREGIDSQATVREVLTPTGGDVVFPGGGAAVHVASWLDRFGFPQLTHDRRVETLSGGERNRLAIARFLLTQANLLILDEPTNDLDIPTLNVLEEALVGFEGCVLVVSHDRYFLDKVATGILAFEADYRGPGVVTYIEGNYTHYAENHLAGLEATRREQERAVADQVRRDKAQRVVAEQKSRAPSKGLSFKERKELEALEADIEGAEDQIAGLETELSAPDLWTDGPERGQALQAELDGLRTAQEARYARWEELQLKLDGE